MYQDNPSWLLRAIRDLAQIANEGQLSDLSFAFAAECRAVGGLPHPDERAKQVRHLNAAVIAQARDIGRVASHLFGIPQGKVEQIARELLLTDPWTVKALDLIDDYMRPSRVATAKDKAEWNPVTGGPAVERWEHDQQQRKLTSVKVTEVNGKPARRRAW